MPLYCSCSFTVTDGATVRAGAEQPQGSGWRGTVNVTEVHSCALLSLPSVTDYMSRLNVGEEEQEKSRGAEPANRRAAGAGKEKKDLQRL